MKIKRSKHINKSVFYLFSNKTAPTKKMKTPAKYFLIFVIFQLTEAQMQEMGKVGDVIFESIEECDDPINKLDFKADIKKNSDGIYKLNMDINFPYDVADQTFMSFQGYKYRKETDDYDTEPLAEFENKELVEFIKGFVPEIWENMKKKISPPVSDDGAIKSGKYELRDFTAKPSEINPAVQVPYGKFLVLLHISQDEELLCIKAKAEVLKPGF